MNIVSAQNLTKIFKDFWNRPKAAAVNDISFSIKRGEIVGLLGPNGSGKSTTIKMMLGLLYPTSGSIEIFDKSPRDVKVKSKIGYLPEETYLYKYLTAGETLDFYGSLFRIAPKAKKQRIAQLLEMTGLANSKNRFVGEFSKGMARRIGIAQAIINDPELVILDEPTSGLDPIGCMEIKNLMSLLKQRGKTILVCSHLLSEIEDTCDRVIIMYGGKIYAEGALSELLTVSEKNIITTSFLNEIAVKKLLKILRDELKEDSIEINNPKKSLEDYFLEVIKKASSEKIKTSGVTSGNKIAEFLSGK
jgi:ABC-2 type transport system ATP-binding protein